MNRQIISLKVAFLLLFLVFYLNGLAQYQLQDDYLQSPNASNLGEYGQIPVSLYNGAANVNIPLHTIKIGSIEVPISLSYNSSGVKVDEHPGWVGLNWTLNAGGVITRRVNDLPDDYHNPKKFLLREPKRPDGSFYFMSDINTIFGDNAGYYYNNFVFDIANLNNLNKEASYSLDTEPDEFIFNFNGITGKFYWNGRDWSVKSNEVVKVDLNGFELLPNELAGKNSDGTIRHKHVWALNGKFHTSTFGGFTLTLKDGTMYIFGNCSSAIEYSIPFNEQYGAEWTASSWFLKEIIDPNGNVISFTYEPDDYISDMYVAFHMEFPGGNPNVTYKSDNQTPYLDGLSFLNSLVDMYDINYGYEENEFTNSSITPRYASYSGSLIRPTYLSKIQTRNEEVSLVRNNSIQLRRSTNIYTSNRRMAERLHYLTRTSPTLSAIGTATSGSGILDYINILRYIFGSGGGSSSVEQIKLRDFYDIVAVGDDTAWPFLCAAANSNDVQNMLDAMKWKKLTKVNIKKISTGEELKTIDLNYNDIFNERLFLEEIVISNNSIALPPYTFEYYLGTLPNYCEEQNDHWGYYNQNTQRLLTIPRSIAFWNSIGGVFASKYYFYKRNPTQSIQIAQIGALRKITYPTGGFNEFVYQQHQYNLMVKPSLDVESTSKLTAGGLRVYQVKTKENELAVPTKKTYYYVNGYDSNQNISNLNSSGILTSEVEYFSLLNYSGLPLPKSIAVASSQNTSSLSSNNNGSHVTYSEVVELNEDNSYTKYFFTNYKDSDGQTHYDLLSPQIIFNSNTLYIPTISKDVERGLLKKKVIFNLNNQPIQQEGYSHKYFYEHSVKATRYGGNFSLRKSGDATVHEFAFYIIPYEFTLSNYTAYKKEISVFDPDGQNPITTTEYFDYNDKGLLIEHSTSQSDGSPLSTEYRYPTDYANPCLIEYEQCRDSVNTAYEVCIGTCTTSQCLAICRVNRMGEQLLCRVAFEYCSISDSRVNAIGQMQDRNIISKPIETVSFKDGNFVTNATLNNFRVNEHNHVVLSSVDQLELESPLPKAQFTYSYVNSSDNFVSDSRYAPKVFLTDYDSKGNLLQYEPEDDVPTSYIWGYNQTRPIAQAINATSNSIAYTSFENYQDIGNWQPSGGTVVKSAIAKTGQYYLNMYSDRCLQFLAVPGIYRLEYWAKSTVNVTGGAVTSISTSLPDANGWILYVKELNIISPTYITLGGIALIDELRLYPADAQMTTYTHNPLVGVTSITDPNNRTIYYEYDGLGRLQTVKDEDGNILKHHEYKYYDQVDE